MTEPTPTPEHLWLQRLRGDWVWRSEALPGHDYPPSQGKERGQGIGDVWTELAGEGDYGVTRMTLGFNPDTGRFQGTWVGSMANHLWVYDGALDESGEALVLEATGPSFTGEGMARFRDVVAFEGPDVRTLRAYTQGGDGAWTHFMTSRYTRVRG